VNKNITDTKENYLAAGIGILISLSIGFIDTAAGIFHKPFSASLLPFLLASFAASTIVFLFIYLCLWLLIRLCIKRHFKAKTASFSLVFFLGTAFTLASLNDLIQVLVVFAASLKFLTSIGIICVVSLCIAAAAWHIASQTEGVSSVSFLATATTVNFLWLDIYRTGLLVHSALLNAGYIVTTLCILALFRYRDQRLTPTKSVCAFVAVILVSYAAALVSPKKLIDYSKKKKQIKHIILLSVDTLRPDFLSCYNSDGVNTENIDKLSKDGVLFKNAYAPGPWTLPSFASIMTGLSPYVHMATGKFDKLPSACPTIAEYMRDVGYLTSAIGSNSMLRPATNVSQGFIEYDFFPKFNSLGVRILKKLFKKLSGGISTRALTDLAINWLDENKEKDFFLWIHYFDPHRPYTPPDEFKLVQDVKSEQKAESPAKAYHREEENLYKGEIRYIDHNIGKLINSLKKLGIYKSSLIVFTSDHGEEFWEHGYYDHGHTLYNELLRVPLIIKPPNSTQKRTVEANISTEDIMPTILELCKVKYKKEYISGATLTPLWGNNAKAYTSRAVVSSGLLYVEEYGDGESVVFGDMKYIRFFKKNNEKLYNLRDDPMENTSIIASHAKQVKQAKNILKAEKKKAKRLKRYYHIKAGEKVAINQDTVQSLKSLGYMQ